MLFRSVLGQQDLGWVNLDQLKGYRTGAKFIDRNMLAWTQEEGGELILGRYDGAMLMPNKKGALTDVRRGDAVIDADGTDTLLSFSENPGGFLQRQISKLKMESMAERGELVGGWQTMNEYNVDMTLNHVVDFKDILQKMKYSSEFEKIVQAIALDPIAGKSKMSKYLI